MFASKGTASNTMSLESMKHQSVSPTWHCPAARGSALSLRQGDVSGPASQISARLFLTQISLTTDLKALFSCTKTKQITEIYPALLYNVISLESKSLVNMDNILLIFIFFSPNQYPNVYSEDFC